MISVDATKVIVVAITALLLAGTGCTGAAALPPTNEPNVAPAVDLQTSQFNTKVEEFNRVYRACDMLSHTDTAGNWIFSGQLVLQEFIQIDQDAIRRVFSFSRLTPLAKRAAISSFCQFKRIEPITNFFSNQGYETAYRSFLENDRPSRAMLNEELNRILSDRQANPLGPPGARFAAVFATPHQAVSAAAQPFLATINLRLQDNVYSTLMDEWLDRFAANPEQYQSQDAIVAIFEEILNP